MARPHRTPPASIASPAWCGALLHCLRSWRRCCRGVVARCRRRRPRSSLDRSRRGRSRPPRRTVAARRTARSRCCVQADEINYDYTNERVSAVGNVQIYYGGSTLEADRVIYDQKTKRLRAEGNVRLTEADGKITYGEIMDLSDDFRDGFVDSLRLEDAEQTRLAAARAERSERQLHGVPQRRLHRLRAVQGRSEEAAALAGQGRAHHPRRGREDDLLRGRAPRILRRAARLYAVLLRARPDGEAQDRLPDAELQLRARSTASASTIPYYWALAPNYDFTLTPMITTRQGPLLQGEWRQRLMNGAYCDPRPGIIQLDKDVFLATTARDAGLSRLPRQHRDHRPVQPQRQVGLGLGRHAARPTRPSSRTTACRTTFSPPDALRLTRRLRACPSSTSPAAATAAISTCATHVLLRLLRSPTIRTRFRSSIR